MKLGISSWAFPWAMGYGSNCPNQPLSAIQLMEKAVSLGAEVVQISDNVPWDNEIIALCKQMADVFDIELELGISGTDKAQLLKSLDIAAKNDINLIRMMPYKKGQPTAALDELTILLTEVVPHFSERQVRLAVENCDRYKAHHLSDAIWSLNSRYIGICYDPANNYGVGESWLECADIFAPLAINFHLKDFTISHLENNMGLRIEGCPAGEGLLNLKRIYDRLYPNCNWVLELWTPWQGDLPKTIALEEQWVKRSLENVRNMNIVGK